VAERPASDEIRDVFKATRGYFLAAALFSLAANLLYLAAPLYMLQVYDRVVSSGSASTLVMLTVALLLALAALAGLDVVRARVLTRAGVRLDRLLAGRVIAAAIDRPARGSARSQPLRDLDTFRQFVSGGGIIALFDLPWVPIYIGVIFLLHASLGFFALGCAIVLVVLALVNERLVRRPLTESNEAAARSYSFTEMGLRNAEVVRAMGMTGGLISRWGLERTRVMDRHVTASDRAGSMTSLIKFLRLAMQSLILGLGALLVITRAATAGIMFAAMVLLGRALQPIEQSVAQWRTMVSARAAWLRVKSLLQSSPLPPKTLALPRPEGHLAVEGLTFAIPGVERPILRNISFHLDPGESLGIIGPSGAGKSTLLRTIVGVLEPSAGAVRLDGADVSVWPHESLGRHVGYLPQDVELFAETIAANIGRFRVEADAEILQAAEMAGVHELILRLPGGYETQVGEGGEVLSGGYRQRIGLARAVFGNPTLVVLDEPSSNLDGDGDMALARCLAELKERGATVIVVSHRPATLAAVDRIMVLRNGVVEMFGDRAGVLVQLNRPAVVQAAPSAGVAGAVAAAR
jgi:PrtD family type I secretion system ABC transporter